jgi:hypothetical protein
MQKSSFVKRIGRTVAPLLLSIALIGVQALGVHGATTDADKQVNRNETGSDACESPSPDTGQETAGSGEQKPNSGQEGIDDTVPNPDPQSQPVDSSNAVAGGDAEEEPDEDDLGGGAGGSDGLQFDWDLPDAMAPPQAVGASSDTGQQPTVRAYGGSYLPGAYYLPGTSNRVTAYRGGVVGTPSPHGSGMFIGTRRVAGSSSMAGNYSEGQNYPAYGGYPTRLASAGMQPPMDVVAFGPSEQPGVHETYRVNAGYTTTFHNYSDDLGEYYWAFEGGDPETAVTTELDETVDVTYNTPTGDGESYQARLDAGNGAWTIDVEVLESPYALVADPVALGIRQMDDQVTEEDGDTVRRPVFRVAPGQEIEFDAEIFGDIGADGGYGWVFDDGAEGTLDETFAVHPGLEATGENFVGSFTAGFYVYNMGAGNEFFYNLDENYGLDPNQPGAGFWYSEVVVEVVDETVQIPEPATFVILGSAATALLGLRRRRRMQG